jgi:hypothetical protein
VTGSGIGWGSVSGAMAVMAMCSPKSTAAVRS